MQVWSQDRAEAQRIAVKESRLGIPLLFGRDVIHGYRTVFPIPLGQAASWDPELIGKAAALAAREASAEGIHWTFAPCSTSLAIRGGDESRKRSGKIPGLRDNSEPP